MTQPSRTLTPVEFLASLMGVAPAELERKSGVLLGNLGMDSLTATRVRGSLSPMPSYQVLYGLTVAQAAALIPRLEESVSSNLRNENRPSGADETFELTPMQVSYVIGASQDCPCQVYSEFDITDLDVACFQEAVRRVVARHPMLHAVIVEGTRQRVLPEPERREPVRLEALPVVDLEQRRQECMTAFRSRTNLHWDLQLSRVDARTVRVHLLLDMLFMDATSAMILCREVARRYAALLRQDVSSVAEPDALAFRDYCDQLGTKQVSAASLDYWTARLDAIPPPPQLPRRKGGSGQGVDFQRESIALGTERWNALKAHASALQVTSNALLLAVFSEVLGLYAEEPDFTVTVTMSERPVSLGNDFTGTVGEFTNVLLCPITGRYTGLAERALAIHRELSQGLEHGDLSGLEGVRMLRKHRADPHLSFPIVFTSFLGIIDSPVDFAGCSTGLHFQQTQTPQITLDHQVYELDGELRINWDYDSQVHDREQMRDMLDCFRHQLERVAQGDLSPSVLPPEVLALRVGANQTHVEFDGQLPRLLHGLVLRAAEATPGALAVIDQDVRLTYAELMALVRAAAVRLQDAGVGRGSCVAVVMEKGWEQVVATTAILLTGAYYLPLNPSHPDDRLRSILTVADCGIALVQDKCVSEDRGWHRAQGGSDAILTLSVDLTLAAREAGRVPAPVSVDPEDLAYVIFTSGSTGAPKGVEISHGPAVNTCLDINARFGLGARTVTFAISSLSFDLSVWDIFGTLGAGGTVVVCKPDGTRDPDYWWQQLHQHQVTVWNTVPTSFEMLIAARPPGAALPLKVAMLSGDAISMTMADHALSQFPDLHLVALGGATEASIWSNFHVITRQSRELGTELVPYGRPLSNQTMHVLDARFGYRPAGVVGDIYIGGVGLARGYFRDPELTASKFLAATPFGRLYATGDLGRYLPNGEIEIVGRKDSQVKVGGHRVELAEIEHCAERLPSVQRAAVVHLPGEGGRLVGFVTVREPGTDAQALEEALRQHAEKYLPDYMVPQRWRVLETLPLTANSKVDTRTLRQLAMASQARTQDSEPVEGNSEVALILQLAAQVLGVPANALSATQNLAEQGLSSLFAVRLVNLLSAAWNTRLSYTLVFNHPSAVKLAAYRAGRVAPRAPVRREASAVDAAEPIAIVGRACRLPGDVLSPDDLWEMLLGGTDCVTEVPASRFDIDEIYDANPEAVGRSYTRRGAFMSEVESFDHDFFGIPVAEARAMDPQQRMLLEVTYEAFHAAGYDKDRLRGSSTGVFIGQMNYDWMTDFGHVTDYAGTGSAPSISSNRISFALDLAGPSMTVDTACSSSLVAVDAAITKLRSGACRMAVAGGANMILSATPYVMTCQARMLSVDSRCATFDSAANGIARGEGVGAVVLKRLSDALADGDPVLAVIRGSAVNQDGRSASLTAPNGLAQEAVIRQALDVAGLEGRDVDYVECHGTGTSLGDPIEVEALKNVLGERREKPVVLGAIKSNIGHLEGAAGVVGLIKALEVLRRREAPGNVHFKSLNPKIDLEGFAAVIPTRPTALGTTGAPLVASVSSFGYGGTNAHVVLESYVAPALSQEPPPADSLWLFTGQGSLVPGAAKGLYGANAVFKDALDRYAAFLESKVEVPLLKLLLSDDQDMAAQVQETQYAQPAIVALQLAQAAMWRARGMRPSTVLGHSVGEFAAAAVAGVMSAEQALELAALRGRLMSECPRGGMAAVRAPVDQVQPLLPPELVVAAENERATTVVAGPKEVLHRFVTEVLGVGHTMLAVSHAFHSPMMAPAADAFRQRLEGVELREPQGVRFISTLTGAVETSRLCTAEYWAEQLLKPVLFLRAVETAWAQGPAKTVVELGPGSTLLQLAKRSMGEAGPRWVVSSQATRWRPGPRLFRNVPLGWNKPVSKFASPRSAPAVEQVTPANCVYETTWMPLPPSTEGARKAGAHLLLTREALAEALPEGWRSVVVKDEAEWLPVVSGQRWATVALWGHGTEEDVALGLRLLQTAQADRWTFVTGAGSEDDAGLWGLARVSRLERPDLRVRCIEQSDGPLAKVLSLASSDDAEDELSVDGAGVVRVPRLRRCTGLEGTGKLPVRPDATYAISGGQGALGKVVARLLVERGATHVLLLSRTSAATLSPELEALRAKARVECVACDVSRVESVREAKAWLETSDWPSVGGVVHAAGVLSDGTLPNQSAEKLRLAYGAKVHGARNLRDAFSPPDFLVLFSSTAAALGSAGQGSYAAANATLDALARKWSSAGEPVLSVQWGAWSDGGMAARHEAFKHAEAEGLGSIRDSLGTAVLERLLATGKRGTVCVSPIDWSRLTLKGPRFELLAGPGGSTKRQTWSRLALQQLVRDCVLQFIPSSSVEVNRSFMEAGFSSLDLVQFRRQLLARLPDTVELPVHFAFNYPTEEDVTQHLFEQLQARSAPTADPEGLWTLLNGRTQGPPLFLVGGVMGTAEKTFGALAAAMSVPVYAAMPGIPAVIDPAVTNLEGIAAELRLSMERTAPGEAYSVGGLSFGAAVAFEMGLQLEREGKLARVVMLDPRHMPPFVAPEGPAPFELLVQHYTPSDVVRSPVLVFQCAIPPWERQSEMMREASRSFQDDAGALERCRAMCPGMELIRSDGHHFNLLHKHVEPLAARIERDLLAPPAREQGTEAIAIVGRACRLPGGVRSPDDLWAMLLAGKDCVTDIPASRFDIDEVFDANPDVAGRSYTRRGAFMNEVEGFDHDFFGISVSEARAMDPQQRLLLEVAYEAFHDAGYDKKRLKGSPTSVHIGLANDDWTTMGRDHEAHSPHFGAGVSGSIASNRISYLLGLTGPSMTLDTACSSSLVAVDLAVEKLRNGISSLALVGGVNVMLHHRMFVSACATKALSPAGRCATFDAAADGYCRGEGVGAIVLKRLSDAVADGDEVLAVIRGTAVNQDGRSASLTAPNGLAQEAVIRQALKVAGLEGRDVDYVECHGTGTSLGDPIEVGALKSVLGERREKPVVLGAIKSNIGHLEGAAGVVGLIKAMEVVRRREAPGNVHFQSLNPKIDLNGFPAVIPTGATPLATGEDTRPLVAGVSSFGFGGTNAHVVLASYGKSGAAAERRARLEYAPRFLPWRRLPHPFLSRKEEDGFVAVLAGEQAERWKDHRIAEQVLVPAASHLTLLGGAALLKQGRDASRSVGVEVQDVVMPRPLVVGGASIVRCVANGSQWSVQEERAGSREFVASCRATRLLGSAEAARADVEVEAVRSRCAPADVEALYGLLLRQGVQFGRGYRNLTQLHLGEAEALARVEVEHPSVMDRGLTLIHPATLDAGIQLLGLWGMKTCGVCLPFNVQSARLFVVEEQPRELWAYARVTASSARSVEGTVTLFGDTGEVYAILEGLTCRQASVDTRVQESVFETEWVTSAATPRLHPEQDGAHLLLMREAVEGPLPSGWQALVVKDEAEWLPVVSGQRWTTVALWSHGAEEDVALGLRLLQTAQTERWVFLTEAGSDGDAGLWGLARTVRLERPEVRLRCIEHAGSTLAKLLTLATNDDAEEELSVDGAGVVRVPRLRRCADVGSAEKLSVRPDATYVISGGQGALGTVAARLLVERGATHVLLLSRTAGATPSPELEALRAKAQVASVACDVSRVESVREAKAWLEASGWPSVGGVVHAAGVLSDATLPNQSVEKLRQAYGAKVHGARNLREVFTPPDFLVLFSSAAAVFGSVGQGSYAAANATLDALARKWSAAGERVLSVQWGAWSDGGMAARQEAYKRAEAGGFGSISDALGTAVLEQLLAAGKRGAVCVSPIDWNRLRLEMPLVSRFRTRRVETQGPKRSEAKGGPTMAELVALVRRAAAESMGLPAGGQVIDDEPLMAQGLDSLGAVGLAQSLSRELGLTLGAVFVLNHPTLEEMAAALAARLENSASSTPAPRPRMQRSEEPIAIVGTACRLPGNVRSPDELWEMLLAGRDCVTEIPSSRFDIDEVFDANPDVAGCSYTRRGAFMSGVESFDLDFFGIPVAEARAMDPHQCLLLEVAYEAFHDAGYDKKRLRGSPTGVFVGVANQDWMIVCGETEAKNPFFGAGVSSSIMSNRISYLLGLTGPSMTLDTACSSSLVAVDLAVEKLRGGVCSTALVGGVNVMLHHRTFVGCCSAKMLSSEGRCATFDASADGYCRGEGVGAVVLKRLSDALADGDEVLAVIRGTAVNQDGRSTSLTAPNGLAQEAVIRQALDVAGLEGRDVDYVECHGTGTSLGDPIEVEALKTVLGERREKPVVLGAIKSNIGHLEGAAGVAGLIKAVEVVRRREAPGNVHFQSLNPKIDLSGFPAVIPTAPTALGKKGDTRPLVAGVSSFGFGGTNAHVVLESYAGAVAERRARMEYAPRFLPWRRLPHPFLSRKEDGGFVAVLAGEQAERWKDHRIAEQVLVPAASHLTLLGGAALLKQGADGIKAPGVQVEDIIMPRPLVVSGEGTRVRCVESGGQWIVEGGQGAFPEKVASCRSARVLNSIDLMTSDVDVDAVLGRCAPEDVGAVYETMSRLGADFGRGYRNLTRLHLGEEEAIARIEVEHSSVVDRSLTLLHPATLDAGIQLLGLCGLKTCGVCLPFSVQSARLFSVEEQPRKLWAYARVTERGARSVEGTVTLFGDTGEVYAVLEGLTCRQANVDTQLHDSLFETEWTPQVPAPNLLPVRSEGTGLLLSRVKIEGATPPGWQVLMAEHEEQWLPVVSGQRWTTVALWSHGAEEDVALGLRLLQTAQTERWVFLTEAGSDGDAGLWGLARTVRLERPEVRLRCIEHAGSTLAKVLTLATSDDVEDELSVDGAGVVRVPRLRRTSDIGTAERLQVRPDATYVISGGQGALGTVAARLLVERGATHVLLLSRTAGATLSPELEALRAKARVESVACDVSRAESVREAKAWLEASGWPTVGGVVHAAGVLSDGTLPNQSVEKLRQAYGAKVHGARNLREVFTPPDFLVLFSSAAAVFGSSGQGSYAAANATLDALARKWSSAGEPVLSVQWGAWSDGGMAARQEAYKRAEAGGFGSISDALGTAALEQLLAAGKRGAVCVSPIDWNRLQLELPLVSRFRTRRVETQGPKRAEAKGGPTMAELVALVRRVAAESMGLSAGGQVIDDEPLMAQGLDSLGAVGLAQSLSRELSLTVGAVFVLNHPTLKELAAALAARLESTTPSTPAPRPRTQRQPRRSEEPIAIVSRACRLPGDVLSPDEMWEMLLAGRDCVTDIPSSRFDIDAVYDPNPNAVGRSYTRRGAFMNEVESFDHDFFGIPVAEARAMDPQQRLLLEVAYEAFHAAGYDKERLRSSRIGVFVGQMNHDWAHMNGEDQLSDPFFGAGSSASITSNRISYLLGLTGPSMTLDTACSSSLVAVDLAVEKLRGGVCSAALVGGVNVMLHSRSFVGCSAAKMLSIQGRCATFDAAADGYCRGEGVGAVVLKRLSDALADGDEVLAVIRGTAVNQDGRSASLTAPNGLAQEAVIRQALDVAGLEGRDVDYVECHGTGTSLGDPIEVEALKNVLGSQRDKPVVLGAVKSNIGHLEGAAGVVGLIKAVEVLRRREAPGNVHFKTLNPKIDLAGFSAVIPTRPTALGRNGEKRPLVAGVSSFGFGGTNAHVVLESWDAAASGRANAFAKEVGGRE
ncbi:non-ribosomal peptide synthetase/type I polyketide synthase [Corallococcus sp. CA049B]|uniref:non-ribosomal peptide synthetase/type I polyketide synthase n=1 Tax=Corallococcus sp. CA049B TaxID=2316730 RepID=UPI001F16865A|nr:non-ribosomal peptide synthetase/type I polyketide synthase [Corallococcus sp. CA049B]